MATPSSNQSTQEMENFLRLSALIVDVGTKVLRDVFDGIYPRATLSHELRKKQHVLEKLYTKNVLTLSQWNKMFQTIGGSDCSSPHATDIPRTGVSSTNFDVALLSLLLSNICNLTPPRPTGWGRLPPTHSQSTAASIVRLRWYRNDLYAHASEAKISAASFAKHWADIKGVLLTLGGPSYTTEIDNLETCDISFIQTQRQRGVLDLWCATDHQLQEMVESISERLDKYLLPTMQSVQSGIDTMQSDLNVQKICNERLTSDMIELKQNHHDYQASNMEMLSSIKNQIGEDVSQKLSSLEEKHQHFKASLSNLESDICPVLMRIEKNQEEIENRQDQMEPIMFNLKQEMENVPTQTVLAQMFATLHSSLDKALKVSSEGHQAFVKTPIDQVLNNMMKTTKLLISETRSHDATFVKTDNFSEAKTLLQANRILILSGFPGEGKTTMATRLMLELAKPERCLVVKSPGEWKHVDTDLFDIILFDDVFGKGSASQSRLGKWKSLFDVLWSHYRHTKIRFVFTSREHILRQCTPSISTYDLMSKHFTKTLTSVSLSEREKLMMMEKQMHVRGLTISQEFLLKCIDNYHPLQGFPKFANYFQKYAPPRPYTSFTSWSFAEEKSNNVLSLDFERIPLNFLKQGLDELYAEDKRSFFGLAALWIEQNSYYRRGQFDKSSEVLAIQWGIHPSAIDAAKNASLDVHDGGYVTKRCYDENFVFAHESIEDMVGLVLSKENPKLVLRLCSDSFLFSYVKTYGPKYVKHQLVSDELVLKINESEYGYLVSCFLERMKCVVSRPQGISRLFKHTAFNETHFIDELFKYLEQKGMAASFFNTEYSHCCSCYGQKIKIPLSVLSICLFKAPPNVELAKRIITTRVMEGGKESWVLFQKSLALAFSVKYNVKEVYSLLLKDREGYNYVDKHRFYLFQLLALGEIVEPYPIRTDAVISQSAVCFAARRGDSDLIKVLLRHLEIITESNVLTGGNNPLHMACKYNRVEVVRLLLGTNLQLNKPNFKKYLPIHLAAVNKHAELVGLLLDFGFSADVRGGKLKKTPLHLAAGTGSVETVRSILQHGASCYKRDKTSHLPLHYAAMFGRVAVAETLLHKGGADQLRMKAYSHSKALRVTSDIRKQARAKGILGIGGKGICQTRIKGFTPLHFAARKGHLETVRLFLRMGADPNVVNSFGQTPLLLAASFGHTEVVSELCQVTSVKIIQKHGFSPLHVAVYRGQTAAVRCILDKSNVDVNETDNYGKAPVHVAAQLGLADIVNLLLERGCDWRMQTYKGDTVLHLCCRHQKIKYNRVYGFTKKKQVSSISSSLRSDHLEVARVFLRKDAGLANVRNKNGKTPFLEADLHNSFSVMKLLTEFGLNIMDSSTNNDTFWQYFRSKPYLCLKY